MRALLAILVLITGSNAAWAQVKPENLREQARAVLARIDGETQLPGLKEPVEVLRDNWGVPHIYAKNADDLFFAQGYVAAQDRMFQLDLWRRLAVGEMAEVMGPVGLHADAFARLILYRGNMDAEWTSYSPDTKQIATAFTNGINACIKQNEKRLPIEFQILGDRYGSVVHLFERECSIQRRHQKVIEESPSPIVTKELRARMGELSVALVKRVGYVNAGTLEFLVDADLNPYFLEMNTRLQVEHAVTEMVTGEDLVKLQVRVARGEHLPFRQEDLSQRGHAIECRVYAEDPDQGFLPSPGRITALRLPGGPGVRDDTGIYEGYDVPLHYDPLLSKLVAWGYSRQDAIRRMRRAVAEYKVLGIKTTLPFFQRVLHHPAFLSGDFDTSFVEKFTDADRERERPIEVAVAAAAIRAYRDQQAARLAPQGEAAVGSAWWRAGVLEDQRGRG
jgi:acetyl/propionyl-CoA carboxylase alpha subunit